MRGDPADEEAKRKAYEEMAQRGHEQTIRNAGEYAKEKDDQRYWGFFWGLLFFFVVSWGLKHLRDKGDDPIQTQHEKKMNEIFDQEKRQRETQKHTNPFKKQN